MPRGRTSARASAIIAAIGTTALLLIAGTALGWSALDVLRKLLAPHLSPLAVVFYLALGQVPVLALWGAATSAGPITPRYLLVAGGSVTLNIVANSAYVAALLRSPLSVSVPLLSLTPAFVATFARPLLGEWPRPVQLCGIALVVAGALLLGGAGAEGGSLAAWWQALRREPGARLMLLVAACWGLALPLDKLGVEAVGPARHALVLCAGISAGTLLVMAVRGRAGELAAGMRGRVLPLLAVAIAVSAVALVLQLLVIRVALVGVVEAVKRAVGNVMALLIGGAFFGEAVGWKKVLALGLLVAGVLLILLV